MAAFYTAALVGLGRIGYTLGFDKLREQPACHTKALLQNKRVKLLYGVDSDLDKRHAWAGFVKGGKTFSSIDELLALFHPDIISVAVNEEHHIDCALKAIAAHPKLLILEKPVALSMREGERLKNASYKEGVPILINHERRFALDYKIARDYTKKIGKLLSVNARLDTSFYVWRKKSLETGEYSLLHDGTHLIDAVLYLLGEDKGERDFLFNEFITKAVWEDFFSNPLPSNKNSAPLSEEALSKKEKSSRTLQDTKAINNGTGEKVANKGHLGTKSAGEKVESFNSANKEERGKGAFGKVISDKEESGKSESCKDINKEEERDKDKSGKVVSDKGASEKASHERVVRFLAAHYESKLCPDVNFAFSGGSRYFGFEIEIVGTQGRVRIGNGVFSFEKRECSKLYSGFYSLARDKSIKKPHKTGYFSQMVQNAVDFLDGKAPLKSSLDTGLATLAIIESLSEKLKKAGE